MGANMLKALRAAAVRQRPRTPPRAWPLSMGMPFIVRQVVLRRRRVPHQVSVFVYPWHPNPYQELLYSALLHCCPTTRVSSGRTYRVLGGLLFPLQAIWRRLSGYSIVHIHWPDFGLASDGPLSRRLSFLAFHAAIVTLRVLRFRVVWTAHNVLPHERRTSDDAAAARELGGAAHAIIVHAGTTLPQLAEVAIPTDRAVIIPHGHYRGVYPVTQTRAEARADLALKESHVAVLFFGLIRPYKGVPELVRIFVECARHEACLIIAGACHDPEADRAIKEAADRRVVHRDGYVEDGEVAAYFLAADLVCLPFRRVTTSGSLMLAMTFGRPVIAPRVGAIAGLPEDVGFFYDADDPLGLRKALTDALARPGDRRARGSAAAAYAGRFSWDELARMTYRVYRDVAAKTGSIEPHRARRTRDRRPRPSS